MTRWMRIFAVTVGLALPALPAHAQTGASLATTVIVLDGSNSMNGRLEGDTSLKFVTAVGALKSALAEMPPGTRVGLAAFGARRQRDCTDAAVLVPPAATAAPVIEMLDSFRPGGYSPVALALETAAGALPKAGGKSTIVLLLDDLASCRSEDPCTMAEKLKSENPALTITVVGLGLKQSEAEVMKCVADKTGGKLFDTSEPNSAMQAIIEAVKFANAAPVVKPAPKPIAAVRLSSQASNTLPPENVLLPGLNLSARLDQGQARLDENVHWRIWRADAGPPAPALASANQPTFNIQLRPGRYMIEASAGLVTKRRAIDVTSADPMSVAVELEAGLLEISAPLAAGGAASATTLLALERLDSSEAGAVGNPVWQAQTSARHLVVPPGRYRIRARDGQVDRERLVKVDAGKRQPAEMPLAAGRLIVEIPPDMGGSTGGSQFVVEEDDPDRPSGRREVLRTASWRLDAMLPAGTYRVAARRGTAEIYERLVVRAGAETVHRMPLLGASVRVSPRIGGQLPDGLPVTYKIERLDGVGSVLQLNGGAERAVELLPGRYRFECRIGRQNAIAVGEAEVKAGPPVEVRLEAQAGIYRLKLADEVSLGFGEVFWQILDEQGRAVWRSSRTNPVIALQAGRYAIKAMLKDRTIDAQLEAKSGDDRTIEVGG